jgi:hypothetical protein
MVNRVLGKALNRCEWMNARSWQMSHDSPDLEPFVTASRPKLNEADTGESQEQDTTERKVYGKF